MEWIDSIRWRALVTGQWIFGFPSNEWNFSSSW